MTVPAAEFSRRVALARLPCRQEIAAEPDERAALAERFGLVALDRLAAVVSLRHEDDQAVLLEASFEASFVQTCVVSLEPVCDAISANFVLRYGAPGSTADEVAAAAEEPAFEPLTSDAIDIGEAVAQELSLLLPAFPRLPGAVIEADPEAAPAGPFAALASRRSPVAD